MCLKVSCLFERVYWAFRGPMDQGALGQTIGILLRATLRVCFTKATLTTVMFVRFGASGLKSLFRAVVVV